MKIPDIKENLKTNGNFSEKNTGQCCLIKGYLRLWTIYEKKLPKIV